MSRSLSFPFLIGIFCSGIACSQDIREFVKQSSVEVKSISPENEDYSDLESIGIAIGDARLVMLGEQDHGDAPTFLAKTRLIKYLHEKKGFNVLAFESDFFALNYGWDHVQKNKPFTDNLIMQSVFPIWTRCKACADLFFDYIPASYLTKKPLIVSGFDNQMSMEYSLRNLGNILDSVIRAIGLPITTDSQYNMKIRFALDPIPGRGFTDSTLYVNNGRRLEEIKKQLIGRIPDHHFWVRIIDNLIQTNQQYRTTNTDRVASMNVRDQMMAENIKWLCKSKFKGEKVIVWAANYHIAKDAGSYMKQLWKKKLITMGSVLENDTSLNKSTYVLGFTSFEGEAGRITGARTKYKIPRPPNDYFESWINPNFEYAFTNFRSFSKINSETPPFHLRGNGHMVNQKEDWTNIFDGVFFIRKMYSCLD